MLKFSRRAIQLYTAGLLNGLPLRAKLLLMLFERRLLLADPGLDALASLPCQSCQIGGFGLQFRLSQSQPLPLRIQGGPQFDAPRFVVILGLGQLSTFLIDEFSMLLRLVDPRLKRRLLGLKL